MCALKTKIFGLFIVNLVSSVIISTQSLTDKDFIKKAIEAQTSFKKSNFRSLLNKHHFQNYSNPSVKIPESFDARDHWPQCKSLTKVRNHVQCAAGWAFTAVATMEDRLCIQTSGEIQIEFSPQDLLSCCEDCDKCEVGDSIKAWKFWVECGLVSGGDYNGLFQGCRPYSEDTAFYRDIPACEKQCTPGYNVSYEEDKYFGESYYLVTGGVPGIQREIMSNGPVQAGLEFYQNFFNHKIGIYRHKPAAKYLGYTYVKLLGWGIDGGTPYWIAVAPWGAEFDNWNGFFKILRGKNEAGIEANVVAGKAHVNRSTFSSSSSPVCGPSSIRSFSMVFTVSWWTFIMSFCTILRKN